MKSHTAQERALKTIVQFQKTTAGELTITAEQFIEAIATVMPVFAGEHELCVMKRQVETEYTCHAWSSKDVAYPSETGREKETAHFFSTATVHAAKNKSVRIIPPAFKEYLYIPVLMRKEPFAVILVLREKGSFTKDEVAAAEYLSQFFTMALKDARGRNKKASSLADETRHKSLLKTQSALTRSGPPFPGYKKTVDYSACTGSDFGQCYRNGEDLATEVVCDITADDTERQAALIYVDTWFAILSQTSIDTAQLLNKLNQDIAKRTSECYASLAVARYNKKTGILEIAGMGSACALFFSHRTMDVKIIPFGAAAGVSRDPVSETVRLACQSGDIVCLCTDGITEAKKSNGDLYGKQSLSELLAKNYFLSPDDLSEKIMKTVSETAAKGVNADDKTLAILKIE